MPHPLVLFEELEPIECLGQTAKRIHVEVVISVLPAFQGAQVIMVQPDVFSMLLSCWQSWLGDSAAALRCHVRIGRARAAPLHRAAPQSRDHVGRFRLADPGHGPRRQ